MVVHPAAWWFACPLIGSLGAAWVALLVAVNPGSIHASTDIMVYPMLTLETILAAATLERAWHDGRRRWWVLHALLLAASAYTHMWGLLLWASAGLAALVLIVGHVRRTRAAPPWLADYLVFNAIAVVLSAVWLARVAGQAGSRSMDHLLNTPGFLRLLTATFDYWFSLRQVVLAVVVLTIALPLLWVRSERTRTGTDERPARGLLLAVCLAFVPQIVCFEISYLKATYLQRYTIACIPFFVVLFAAALIWIRPRWMAVGLGLFVAVWPIVPLNRAFDGIRHAERRRTPLAQLAQIVRDQARDGDVIYIFPEFYASSFNWYYRGDLPQICYPTLKRVETVDWHTYADRIEDPQAITRAEEHLFARLGPTGGSG